MKSNKASIALCALALMSACSAFAQNANAEKYYLEAGYTQLKITDPAIPDTKPAMARFFIGMNVHPNVAVEGMVAFNAKSDNIRVSGVNVGVKVDNAYGLFLKPKVQVTEGLTAFARVGYVKSKVAASIGPISVSDSDDSLAYGAGISYKLSQTVSLNFDYTSYYNKDGTKVKGTTLGLGYAF